MSLLSDNKRKLFLPCYIIALFFLNAYNLTYNAKPTIHHQWRQSDCLSITKNYYEEGMHFFEPKIHWQDPRDGKVVSEMPLLNYAAAMLWKLFGQSEGIYRLLNYLIYLVGILFLFRCFLSENNSFLLSFTSVSFLLTSPLLAYYSYNFLPDAPALGLAITAFCLLINSLRKDSSISFLFFVVCATLATLLKASAIFPLLMGTFILFMQLTKLNEKFNLKKLPGNIIVNIVLLAGAYALVLSWYSFAKNYNLANGTDLFLTDPLPVWNMKGADVFLNLSILFNELVPIFFNRFVVAIFIFLVVFVILNFKHLDAFFRFSFIFAGLFCVAFVLLFFQVFNVHDYYLINLMIFPVIILLSMGNIVQKRKWDILSTKKFAVTLGLLIFWNSFYSAAFYRMRTIKDDKICYWYPFISHNVTFHEGYLMWEYAKEMGQLKEIKDKFRKLGINRNEIFLSMPDISPNNSLYLIDQKGYTVARDVFKKDSLWKLRAHYDKAQYVLIYDSTLKSYPAFRTIEADLKQIWKEGNVELFKVEKN